MKTFTLRALGLVLLAQIACAVFATPSGPVTGIIQDEPPINGGRIGLGFMVTAAGTVVPIANYELWGLSGRDLPSWMQRTLFSPQRASVSIIGGWNTEKSDANVGVGVTFWYPLGGSASAGIGFVLQGQWSEFALKDLKTRGAVSFVIQLR